MNIAAIRDGIKARLATVDGLRCHDTIPDSVVPPAAVVVPGEVFIDYQEAFKNGLAVVHFKITILVGRVSERSGQDILDGYLSSGAGQDSSLIDAIMNERTLRTDKDDASTATVDDCCVDTAGDYGTTTVANTEFIKADLNLRVLVGRQ